MQWERRRHEEELILPDELIAEDRRVWPLALVNLQDRVLLLLHGGRERVRRPRQGAHAGRRLERALWQAHERREGRRVHEVSEAMRMLIELVEGHVGDLRG